MRLFITCKRCKIFLDEQTSQRVRNTLVVSVKYLPSLSLIPFLEFSFTDNHYLAYYNRIFLTFFYNLSICIGYILLSFASVNGTLLK